MIAILVLIPAISFHTVGPITARSSLSWWNEVYAWKGEIHDFHAMFSPLSEEQFYLASTSNDVVHGVALVKKAESFPLLQGIACHPDRKDHATLLVEECMRRNYTLDLSNIQPLYIAEASWLISKTALPP